MSEATIRAAVLTAIQTVSNYGDAYDYVRWAVRKADFDSLFVNTIGGTVQVRFWMLTLTGFDQVQTAMRRDAKGIHRQYAYRIDGYMTLDDSAATEKTFVALVEDVVEAMDQNATLNLATTAYNNEPAQVATIDHVMYGGVLCHHAVITKMVAEWLTT